MGDPVRGVARLLALGQGRLFLVLRVPIPTCRPPSALARPNPVHLAMVSASSCATTFSCLVDRTRVPDPALQRHAVAAFFRRLLTLPALLPVAAHDGISSLLASPHAVVAAHAVASLARLAASRADLLAPDHALPFLLAPLSASPSPRVASCLRGRSSPASSAQAPSSRISRRALTGRARSFRGRQPGWPPRGWMAWWGSSGRPAPRILPSPRAAVLLPPPPPRPLPAKNKPSSLLCRAILIFSLAFIPCPHMFFRLLTRQENKGIVTAMSKKEKRNTETEVRRWGWGPPMRCHTDSSDCSLDSVAIAWSRPATAPFACTHKGLRACLAASVLLAGLLMVLIFCCWVDD